MGSPLNFDLVALRVNPYLHQPETAGDFPARYPSTLSIIPTNANAHDISRKVRSSPANSGGRF